MSLCQALGFWKISSSLWLKIRLISNCLYALIHCQFCVHLYPLACITLIREVKTLVSGILHARKFHLKARLNLVHWTLRSSIPWTSYAVWSCFLLPNFNLDILQFWWVSITSPKIKIRLPWIESVISWKWVQIMVVFQQEKWYAFLILLRNILCSPHFWARNQHVVTSTLWE